MKNTKISTKQKNKLISNILKEFKYDEKFSKYTHKELGDYLITNFWSKEKWGSEKCAALDRVINILFEIDDIKKSFNLRGELVQYLDKQTINSNNIGGIRKSCSLPWDSEWNSFVRQETANRENKIDKRQLSLNLV